jgi:hypothetical protein
MEELNKYFEDLKLNQIQMIFLLNCILIEYLGSIV